MNRRGFIASLAAVLAAPQVLIPKAQDAYRWVTTPSGFWVLNPEWVNAQYEIVTGTTGLLIHPRNLPIPDKFRADPSTFPIRFNTTPAGRLVGHIPPIIPYTQTRRIPIFPGVDAPQDNL